MGLHDRNAGIGPSSDTAANSRYIQQPEHGRFHPGTEAHLCRYDMELWNASDALDSYNVVFKPGVNEDIAATAAWGSQYVGTFPGATVDGVFSIWYGKAPGMDRSMDALRTLIWPAPLRWAAVYC